MKTSKATAIVLRGNSVLLVRVAPRAFAMPVMNIRDPRDPAIAVACRQLSVVLDMEPLEAKRLKSCDVTDGRYEHKVVRVDTDSEPTIMGGITEFIWWDRVTPIPRYDHVDDILAKYDQHTNPNTKH